MSTQSAPIRNTSTVCPTDKVKNIVDLNLENKRCNTDQTTEISHSESLSKSATEYNSAYDANSGDVSLATVNIDKHTTYLGVKNKLSCRNKQNVVNIGHNTMRDSNHATVEVRNPDFISIPAAKPRLVSNISTNSTSSSISIEKRAIKKDAFGDHCNFGNSSDGYVKEMDNSSSSHGSNTHLKIMGIEQRSTGPRIQGFLQRLNEAAAFIYCHDCDHVDGIIYIRF